MNTSIADPRKPIRIGEIITVNGEDYEVQPSMDGSCEGCDYRCGKEGAILFACSPEEDIEQDFPPMILKRIDDDDQPSEDMSWTDFYKWKLC